MNCIILIHVFNDFTRIILSNQYCTFRYKLRFLSRSIAFLIFFALLSKAANCQSNVGTEFWLSFMEHVDQGDNNMVVMISATVATSGIVEIPNQGFSRSFTVNQNDVVLINLPASAETVGSGRIQNNGVRVTSELPVSVYIHQYSRFRSEASVVLPVDALSTEYFVLCYSGISAFNNGGWSEFLVVATRDETSISIIPSDDTTHGVRQNETETIMLDQGETYQVAVPNGTGDLTGSIVTSDKTVAVFAGASWSGVPMNCGTFDNLLEQMYPIDTWGSRYITVPMKDVDRDVFRILASEDNTRIEVIDQAGSINEYTIDRGEFVEYSTALSTSIVASSPILVAQYIIGKDCTNDSTNGDPSMVILNTVEQTRDTVSVFNSSLQNIVLNYVIIISRSGEIDNIKLDGQQVANSIWENVGSTSEFAFARIQVQPGPHTITSSGCGVIAMSFGLGDAESYAYSGGANFTKINAVPIPDGGCVGLPIEFDSGLPPKKFDVEWDLGNGEMSRDHQFKYTYPSEVKDYQVSLRIYDRCFDEEILLQKTIKVTFRTQVTADQDSIQVCEGQSFTLGATDVPNASYEWNGPGDFFEEIQFLDNENANTEDAGIYEVIGIVFGCATFPDFVDVSVIPTPEPYLGIDSVICTRGDEFHILNPGPFSAYNWDDGSIDATFPVREPGLFSVRVEDEFGCIGQDSILLEPQCPTVVYMPNAFAPLREGENNLFGLGVFSPQDVIEMDLKVYDRWGNLLFQSQDPTDKWDGKTNGTIVEQGSYAWVLNYTGFDEVGDVFTESLTGTVFIVY